MRLALLRAPLPGWRMRLAHWAGAGLDHTVWSHGEIVFSDRVTGSSWARGGVRLRRTPDEHYGADIWDYFTLPDRLEAPAREWFTEHSGAPYDLLGPARFALGIVRQRSDRYYCHEAIAEALGLPDSWRWTGGLFVAIGPKLWPGEFHRVLAPWQAPWPSVLLKSGDVFNPADW